MNPTFKPAPVEWFPGGAARLPSPWAHALHKPVFALFVLCAVFRCAALVLDLPAGRLEILLWSSAAATSLTTLARRLPAQNVLMSALLIGGLSFGFAALAAIMRVPFGPRQDALATGPSVLGVPWSFPLLWVAVIVNGRGLARLILRPWRNTGNYGFHVIGLACLLAVLFGAGLETGAAAMTPLGVGATPGAVARPNGEIWMHSAAWFAVALMIHCITTPWLINKQPVDPPADYQPLATWLLLNACLLTGQAVHGRWSAAAFYFALNLLAAVLSLRNDRHSHPPAAEQLIVVRPRRRGLPAARLRRRDSRGRCRQGRVRDTSSG